MILERHIIALEDASWILPVAQLLFDTSMKHAWDNEYGGLFYGFAPVDYHICDADKYFWVQAEALAASSSLAYRTKDLKYTEW